MWLLLLWPAERVRAGDETTGCRDGWGGTETGAGGGNPCSSFSHLCLSSSCLCLSSACLHVHSSCSHRHSVMDMHCTNPLCTLSNSWPSDFLLSLHSFQNTYPNSYYSFQIIRLLRITLFLVDLSASTFITLRTYLTNRHINQNTYLHISPNTLTILGPEPSLNGRFAEFRLTFRFWITMVRVAQIRFGACSTFTQQLKNIQRHTGSFMNLPEYSSMLQVRGSKYLSHRPDASRWLKYALEHAACLRSSWRIFNVTLEVLWTFLNILQCCRCMVWSIRVIDQMPQGVSSILIIGMGGSWLIIYSTHFGHVSGMYSLTFPSIPFYLV